MENLSSAELAARIRTLFETLPDIVFFKDPQGAFLFANQAFEHLYGYTLEQIRGKSDFSFLSHEEAEYFALRDADAIAAGKPTVSEGWQVNELTSEQECYETIKTPVYAEDGTLLGLLGIGRNLTPLRLSQDASPAANPDEALRLEGRMAELTALIVRFQEALGDSPR